MAKLLSIAATVYCTLQIDQLCELHDKVDNNSGIRWSQCMAKEGATSREKTGHIKMMCISDISPRRYKVRATGERTKSHSKNHAC
jgi:hypothetical protein